MNRKISICIIIVAIGLLAFTFLYAGNDTKTPETQDSEMAEETQPEEAVAASTGETASYPYILRECDGRVVVYCPDSEEIYMETGILVESLPADVKTQLTDGIGVVSEERLFDFLESYSS